MNANVTVFPLGDLCNVVGGGTPPKDRAEYYNGDIPWATVRDMRSEVIADTEFKITSEAVDSSATNIIPAGNVVIATRVGLGKVCLIERPTAINQDLRGIIPRDPEQLVVKYLFWWLKSVAHLIEKEGTGATVQGVKLPFVKSLPLPLRSVAEQRRIVATLDEAFEGIATAKANAEKNLQNARSIFTNGIDSMMRCSEWQRRSLGELCSDVEYGSSAKSKSGGRMPVLRMGNIQNGSLHWDRLVYTDDEDEIKKYLLRHNDVLFNRTNSPELVGKTAVYKAETPAIFAGYLIRINRKEELLDADFLCYFLNSQAAIDYGRTVVISSVNQANINGTKLKTYPIPTPSLAEQVVAVARLEKLSEATRRLEDLYRRKIAALDALKSSLLRQAFTGQLAADRSMKVAQQPAFQTTNPEFTANVIAFAHAQHERQKRDKTFGHVKVQKVLHLVEAIAKIDLGRRPMKDAAGPNDMQHMRKAEAWARTQSFFDMVEGGERYEFKKLGAFDAHMATARQALAPYLTQLDRVIDLVVPMDTDWAQVFTTVHAAWNNLLIDGAEVTDDAIVRAARENWHAAKLRIPERKFRDAIGLIREKHLVPDGTAKYVGGQISLL